MSVLQNNLEAMQAYPILLQAVGIIGFLTYMIGFALVQSEKICGNGIAYPASKVFAATCVLVSLVGAFNLASCLIQLSYIAIGLYGIGVRRQKPRPENSNALDNPIPSSRHHTVTAGQAAPAANTIGPPPDLAPAATDDEFDPCAVNILGQRHSEGAV